MKKISLWPLTGEVIILRLLWSRPVSARRSGSFLQPACHLPNQSTRFYRVASSNIRVIQPYMFKPPMEEEKEQPVKVCLQGDALEWKVCFYSVKSSGLVPACPGCQNVSFWKLSLVDSRNPHARQWLLIFFHDICHRT